ncbi:hypothetical protein ACFLZY_00025 [Patescibacteria group bacterium]
MTHWKAESKNNVSMAAVVSTNGHVVGKNYEIQQLHQGDLGLRLRLDRGKIKEMTPEQRSLAAQTANEMHRELMTHLGAEEPDGFQPGMVVQVVYDQYRQPALVAKVSEAVVVVRCFRKGNLVLKSVSFHRHDLEEAPGFHGLEGLCLYQAINGPFYDLSNPNGQVKILRQHGLLDNPELLHRIVLESQSDELKGVLIELVECHEVLTSFVLDELNDGSLLEKAMEKITDEAYLIEVSLLRLCLLDLCSQRLSLDGLVRLYELSREPPSDGQFCQKVLTTIQARDPKRLEQLFFDQYQGEGEWDAQVLQLAAKHSSAFLRKVLQLGDEEIVKTLIAWLPHITEEVFLEEFNPDWSDETIIDLIRRVSRSFNGVVPVMVKKYRSFFEENQERLQAILQNGIDNNSCSLGHVTLQETIDLLAQVDSAT